MRWTISSQTPTADQRRPAFTLKWLKRADVREKPNTVEARRVRSSDGELKALALARWLTSGLMTAAGARLSPTRPECNVIHIETTRLWSF